MTTQAPSPRRKPVAVFVASPFPGEQVERIAAVDRERVRLIYPPDLLYPRRHPADHPFWERPDVLLSPHCGGGSPFEHERIVDIFTDNLPRYLSSQPMRNLVDKHPGY